MAYSKDYRERAVAYKNEGHTFKQLREAFGIPPETYYDWQKKIDSGFNFGVKAKGERSRKTDREKLRQAVTPLSSVYTRFSSGIPAISAAYSRRFSSHPSLYANVFFKRYFHFPEHVKNSLRRTAERLRKLL